MVVSKRHDVTEVIATLDPHCKDKMFSLIEGFKREEGSLPLWTPTARTKCLALLRGSRERRGLDPHCKDKMFGLINQERGGVIATLDPHCKDKKVQERGGVIATLNSSN